MQVYIQEQRNQRVHIIICLCMVVHNREVEPSGVFVQYAFAWLLFVCAHDRVDACSCVCAACLLSCMCGGGGGQEN